MVKRNEYIDDDNLSELSSLTHLLDNDDGDNDTNDTHTIKHSPFFNENQFINLMSSNSGLSILDLNVCNAFTKYDELALFVNRVNINNPISVICLNECWLSVQSDVSSLHLPNYDMYYQVGNCPGHTHCGLITYVHNSFKSNEININYDATGWEHLTIEISYNSPNAKKYLVSNIYRPPEKYVAELDEFITEFSSFLTLLQHRIRTSFICGDFNVNHM